MKTEIVKVADFDTDVFEGVQPNVLLKLLTDKPEDGVGQLVTMVSDILAKSAGDMDAIRSGTHKARSFKTKALAVMKKVRDEQSELPKKIRESEIWFETAINQVIEEARKPLTELEKKQAEELAKHQAVLDEINALGVVEVGVTSAVLVARLERLAELFNDDSDYGDLHKKIKDAAGEAVEKITSLQPQIAAQEEQAAVLEAQRLALEEAQRKMEEQQAQIAADQKKLDDAKAEAERLEREKLEAKAKAEREAAEALELEEQLRIQKLEDEELAYKMDAQREEQKKAAIAERERQEREAAAAEAKAKRDKKKREKSVIDALATVAGKEVALEIFKAIQANEIPYVQLTL